jgi:glucarate dehydratase
VWNVGDRYRHEPIEPEDGEVAVPATPGLGVELDMDRIAALRVDL